MHTEPQPAFSLPTYGEESAKPGMYLGLFHGRDEPKQKMDDWGFKGPMIGPLRWVHTTYTQTIKIAFESVSDAARFFSAHHAEHFMELDGDLLVFAGKYYGDWTVFVVDPEDCERPPDSFRRNQRCNRYWAHSACHDSGDDVVSRSENRKADTP